MSNYQQPDYRVPSLQGTGVFVFQTEVPINAGPNDTAAPVQSDFRVPTTAGGVIPVESELPLNPGPGELLTYTQPGGPRPGFPNG